MTNAWVSEWVFRNEATFLRRPRSVQCGSHFGVFDNLAFRVFRRQALVRCLTELPLEFSSPCRLPDPQRFNVLYLTQLTTLHVSVLNTTRLMRACRTDAKTRGFLFTAMHHAFRTEHIDPSHSDCILVSGCLLIEASAKPVPLSLRSHRPVPFVALLFPAHALAYCCVAISVQPSAKCD